MPRVSLSMSYARSRANAVEPEPLQLFAMGATANERSSGTRPHRPHPAEESLERVARAAVLVAEAQQRFRMAVIAARAVGCSWRRIGTAAGVPFQSLHRTFAERVSRTNGH